MKLSDDKVREAADVLVGLRAGRLVAPGLPVAVTPDNTEDVQRVINAVTERVDRPILGWKLYSVYKAMQPPFFAPVYDLFSSGAQIPADISPGRLIEPEVMFRADVEMPPRPSRYQIHEVMASVTAVIGFEVIGSRFGVERPGVPVLDDGQGSLYGSFADHIANGCVVIGDTIANWQDVDFEDIIVRLSQDDRQVVSTLGCHPFDNPFLPVIVAVNRLRRYRGVQAGQIILTSSSTSVQSVAAGTTIRAVYETLGQVTASFAHARNPQK